MNGTAMDDETLKTLARLLPDVAAAHRSVFALRYDWAGAERMNAFQRTFDADNQAIARDYLGEELVPLFPPRRTRYPSFPGSMRDALPSLGSGVRSPGRRQRGGAPRTARPSSASEKPRPYRWPSTGCGW